MLSDELLDELHRLNRTEKLRVIQLLANDLAQQETLLIPGGQYEVWSPYDAAGAAEVLMKMLDDDKKSRDV
jgi:hypothetical protein